MKILLHGLNFAPEEVGIGKYSGEMVTALAREGCEVVVVTTPPYYPHWKIQGNSSPYRRERWQQENCTPGRVDVIRCPLWVPAKVNAIKRIFHLASFGLTSIPSVAWNTFRFRPDVIITIEPAAFCLPTTWLAARLSGAKAWLHVQDFEIDAAFELGLLKNRVLKRVMLGAEAWLMRRFDRVSSISPKMVARLDAKRVPEVRQRLFPNWVDCNEMRPLPNAAQYRARFGLPENKIIALYAGNIGAKQGLELVVEAAERCADNPNIHFVICGNGAVGARFAEHSKHLPNLQMLPVQPFETFNQLMNCADIHLLPQRGDAADLVMPSKLTGMLATGRPVVACAAKKTQIGKVVAGHGLLVPPGDAVAFTKAIVHLASDPDLRREFGCAAREYAEEHMSRDAILGAFYDELRFLVDRTNRLLDSTIDMFDTLIDESMTESARVEMLSTEGPAERNA